MTCYLACEFSVHLLSLGVSKCIRMVAQAPLRFTRWEAIVLADILHASEYFCTDYLYAIGADDLHRHLGNDLDIHTIGQIPPAAIAVCSLLQLQVVALGNTGEASPSHCIGANTEGTGTCLQVCVFAHVDRVPSDITSRRVAHLFAASIHGQGVVAEKTHWEVSSDIEQETHMVPMCAVYGER